MSLTDTQMRDAPQPQASSTPRSNGALTVSESGEKQKVGYANAGAFELMQRAANALSRSTLVPQAYQNNIPNCMIALGISSRTGADVLMVMQNLDIIHGRPSWRAQFLIGTANTCGRFSAIRYEFFGEPNSDSWGCRASATEKATGEKLVGPDITIGMTKKEGWYAKSGSKWQTMPQLMLMYRSGSWWVRAYAPELSLGFHTADEVADILDATPRNDGSYGVDQLKRAQAMLGERKDDPPHDQTTGEILDQETIDAGESVLAQEAADDAHPLADMPDELLALANCTGVAGVDRIEKEVGATLTGDKLAAWAEACSERAAALMAGKRK